MKSILSICRLLPLLHSTSFAQGYVIFANVTLDLTIEKPILNFATGDPLTSEYVAQLFAGPDGAAASALCPVDSSVAFFDGPDVSGLFVGPALEVPGVPTGETGTFEVRVWPSIYATWPQAYASALVNSHTIIGRSGPFRMKTGNESNPTELATAMPQFGLGMIPEPSAVTIIGLGMMVFWSVSQIASNKQNL